MEEKVRELEKMTVNELREEAKNVYGLVGVHAMKKGELLSAIEAKKNELKKGEEGRGAGPDEKKESKVKQELSVTPIGELKKKIRALKRKKIEAEKIKDRNNVLLLKNRIKKMKKKTRRLAKEAAA